MWRKQCMVTNHSHIHVTNSMRHLHTTHSTTCHVKSDSYICHELNETFKKPRTHWYVTQTNYSKKWFIHLSWIQWDTLNPRTQGYVAPTYPALDHVPCQEWLIHLSRTHRDMNSMGHLKPTNQRICGANNIPSHGYTVTDWFRLSRLQLFFRGQFVPEWTSYEF